ncbi:hypothetical protein [Thiocapsa sp.]|uniref:hypothetical protein n=1 Tax=Thiocapsa sp. TaxID=2024551 RepID=UPI003593AAAA
MAAPLHHSDLEGELARHIEKKGREAIDFVRLTVQEMRDRTGALATTAPGSLAAYDPFDKQWLPQVCALLADPEAAAARIMAAVGADLDTTVAAGLPIAERRAAVAKLDEQIAAGEQTESALIQGLQAAGIRIAMPNDPIPEPRPGDEKIVGGELCRWISFTGFAGTFGWFPISRLARGESEAA